MEPFHIILLSILLASVAAGLVVIYEIIKSAIKKEKEDEFKKWKKDIMKEVKKEIQKLNQNNEEKFEKLHKETKLNASSLDQAYQDAEIELENGD